MCTTTKVRAEIRAALDTYCKTKAFFNLPPKNYEARFDLNHGVPLGENIKWLANDALSHLTDGDYGTAKAFAFGSFRLKWEVGWPVLCCKRTAVIAFTANDTLRLGSGTRILKTTTSILPDEPFGKNAPLDNVDITWKRAEAISF